MSAPDPVIHSITPGDEVWRQLIGEGIQERDRDEIVVMSAKLFKQAIQHVFWDGYQCALVRLAKEKPNGTGRNSTDG